MKVKNTTKSHDESTAELNKYDSKLIEHLIKIVREEVVAYQRQAGMESERKVTLRTAGSIEFVKIHDILRCEAQGRYTKVYFGEDEEMYVSMHLKEVEDALQSPQFIRCHNSHLVNRNKIRRYTKADGGYFEMINGDQVPVARARKEHIMSRLNDARVRGFF